MVLLNLTRWPTGLIFVLAGLVAACFAFVTVNLFSVAMANVSFLREHGALAVQLGALWQLAGLIGWGAASLAMWVVFKICEQILEDRYLTWARSKNSLSEVQDDLDKGHEAAPTKTP